MKLSLQRGLLAGLILLGACGESPVVPAADTLRHTAQGRVVGFHAQNNASVWMGVPYGASTAGDRRWRAPQAAPSWRGVREALEPAPRCAQLTNRFDEDEGLESGLVIGSEDCLTLDIYAPAEPVADELPVMVWIHGGGNVWGRSSSYDGSNLANNTGMVIVAVQYRLGPLGWFAHPLLRNSAEHPHDKAASFAVLDLIASLQWVRDNISQFGGDADRVTIAGESHGGYNVMALLASPLAEGLFHRAIIQSGGFDSMSIAEAQGDVGQRQNPSGEIVRRLGIDSAETLRGLPVSELLGAYTTGTGFLDIPRVIEDGVALPAFRLRQAFASTDTFNTVPILMGSNLDEMKLFYVGDPRFIEAEWGVFPVVKDPQLWDLFTRYLARLWRVRAVDEPALAMEAAGHEDVYAYRFDWDDGGKFLSIDMHTLFGASHGFEIPFVFNRFEHLGPSADGILFESETADERAALSHAMGQYWSGFVKHGAPLAPDQVTWPRFTDTDGSFVRFDTRGDGGIEIVNGPADTLDKLLRDLNTDERLDDQTRCLIVSEALRWMFALDIERVLREQTGCGGPETPTGS